jgi:hypothetical protein
MVRCMSWGRGNSGQVDGWQLFVAYDTRSELSDAETSTSKDQSGGWGGGGFGDRSLIVCWRLHDSRALWQHM